MSDTDEENDKAGGQDSSRPGVSDGDVDIREDEKENFGDFFDACGGAVIGDHPFTRSIEKRWRDRRRPVGPLDSAELDYEEYVDLMPIHPTPFETASPAFPPPPPIIAKTKVVSSAKSRKSRESRAHVPFPSGVVEGAQEDRSRRVP
ncbi:hypothetical protein EI94DRAFT_1798661 [Lactarius quietus]|nr:hypothetical protein EI94DRAFT_1798661 [Lactarius quietus]